MHRAYNALLLTLFFSLCIHTLNSQSTPPAAKPAPEKPASKDTPYDPAKEAIIVEKSLHKLRYEADGTGVSEISARIKVLADAGVKNMAILTFTYSADNEKTSVDYVRVIKPDGSVIDTPSYNAQDLPADVTREAPMYSDVHQIHVAVKALGVGDTLEYKTTNRILKPYIPGQFWHSGSFGTNNIYLDQALELDVPTNKPIQIVSSKVQPTITKANGRTIYRWASKNLTHPDPEAPEPAKKDRHADIQISTFKNWSEIGAWYKSLADTQTKITPAIQARAQADIQGLTSDDDKIRAIFSDVALHIHYISLSFGIGRFQPHAADEVLSNQYGDCKDKHTLLTAMLKAAGYQAWPVLISTEDELDERIALPSQFNHVITLVPLNSKLLWMDSTEEVAPVGIIHTSLRNKKALAMPSDKPAYLIDTPVDLPFIADSSFTVNATLSDTGELKGSFALHFHGESGISLQANFRNVAQSDWQNLAQNISRRSGFGGDVTNVKVSDIQKLNATFDITYDYDRQHYSDFENFRISPALPPSGWGKAPGSKEIKPLEEIELISPETTTHKSVIHLPKGWTVNLPRNFHITEDFAEYHATYAFANDTLNVERNIIIKKSHIPLSNWDKYLAFRHAIYDDETSLALLNKPGGNTTSTSNAAENYKRDQVDDFFQPLINVVRDLHRVLEVAETNPPAGSQDLKDALDIVVKDNNVIDQITDKVDARDERSLYLTEGVTYAWTLRGWIELDNKNYTVAESCLKAAWALGQDRLSGYLLGLLYEARNQKALAIHQYELASVSDVLGPLGGEELERFELLPLIRQHYKSLTGSELKATPLRNGIYAGSLSEELDNLNLISKIVQKTKFNGEGYYLLRFELGKRPNLVFMGGTKGYEKVTSQISAYAFEPIWPSSSGTILYREAHIICSSDAGCDLTLMLPTKLKTGSSVDNLRPKHK